MLSVIFTIVSFVFVLGVMILVHEFGHFAAAKLLGIRVETFSIGFGPRLIGFRKGDTDYRIALLPLGGYVKMTGENPDETITGAPDEFISRPKLHRLAVILAGPIMNIVLAVALFAVYFMAGAQVEAYKSEPALIGVVSKDGPAEKAGLRIGDRIVQIDGKSNPTWEDVELAIITSPRQPVGLAIERDGRTLDMQITPETVETMEAGFIGVGPLLPHSIARVEPNSPAAKADLRPGDEIMEVAAPDGKTASGYYAIVDLVRRSASQPLIYRIRRGAEVLEKTIRPVEMQGGVRTGYFPRFRTIERKYGPVGAVWESIVQNYKMTILTYRVLGRILTGRASIKSMSGPIDIARLSGSFAAEGTLPLMQFMAIVSLNLAVFNLLPIPVLDGGVIALLLVEAVIGRDLSLKVKERIFHVGYIFLIMLMGVVLFNDIAKNVPTAWFGK